MSAVWQTLGYREGMHVLLDQAPEDYAELIAGAPEHESATADVALIHAFCHHRMDAVHAFTRLKPALHRDGAMWLSWPAANRAGLDGGLLATLGRAAGLEPAEPVALGDHWMGLRFTIPAPEA